MKLTNLTPDQIDGLVDEWHDLPESEWKAKGKPTLSEYLGWSDNEYSKWVETRAIPE